MEKITLDMLSGDSVSIKRQKYIVENGAEFSVGEITRKAYVNSPAGRRELEEDIAEPYKSVVLLMWGTEPTITDVTD